MKNKKDIRDIKVLTLNTGGVPPYISMNLNTLRSPTIRALEIVKVINTKYKDYDVICLQEVFNDECQNIFKKGLEEHYQYALINIGRHLFLLDSGLAVFSKLPIIEHQFVPFKTLIADDMFANKGFVGLKLEVGPGEFISVYNTHLQSDADTITLFKYIMEQIFDSVESLRSVQLTNISAHIKSWGKIPPKKDFNHKSTIVCGDFNVHLSKAKDDITNTDLESSAITHLYKTIQCTHESTKPRNIQSIHGSFLSHSFLKKSYELETRLEPCTSQEVRPMLLDGILSPTNHNEKKPKISTDFGTSSDHLAIKKKVTLLR